jgi:hypothetical protein
MCEMAADVNTLKVPDSLPDEKVIFLSDIMPTGVRLIRLSDTIIGWHASKSAAAVAPGMPPGDHHHWQGLR